jgi:hypothetical protein
LTKFKIKLEKVQIDFLLSFPEKGMGYQVVDLVLKTGEVLKDITILNSEIAETNKLIDNSDIEKIVIK